MNSINCLLTGISPGSLVILFSWGMPHIPAAIFIRWRVPIITVSVVWHVLTDPIDWRVHCMSIGHPLCVSVQVALLATSIAAISYVTRFVKLFLRKHTDRFVYDFNGRGIIVIIVFWRQFGWRGLFISDCNGLCWVFHNL